MVTLGVDCGHSLAASTWILQRDGTPLAGGKCDARPWIFNFPDEDGFAHTYIGNERVKLDHVTIESIHAEASFNSTGKVRQYGSAHNVSGTLFTEGYLAALFATLYPTLPVHLIPRVVILRHTFSCHPYRRGLSVDKAILAALQRLPYPGSPFILPPTIPPHLAPLCKRNGLLSTPDKRDAYLAAIYTPA